MTGAIAEPLSRNYLRRTYGATVALAAVAALWLWVSGHAGWALSLLGGAGLALGAFYLTAEAVWAVTRGSRTSRRGRRMLLALQGAKYLLLGGALYLMVLVAHAEPISLACGVTLIPLVIVLRVLGGGWSRSLTGKGN